MTCGEPGKITSLRRAFCLLFAVAFVFLLSGQLHLNAQNKDDDFLISLPSNRKDAKKQSEQESASPRANEMLQGVVYDLKQTKDLAQTGNLDTQSSWEMRVRNSNYTKILQKFVLGSWKSTTDAQGNIRYPELDAFYCSPTRIWNSCFYLESVSNSQAPELLQCGDTVRSGGWVAVFSGYVVVPFTGKFRFVGIADDVLLVRFNRKIVLDYGWFSCTMGTSFDSLGNYKTVLGSSAWAKKPAAVSASPLYSNCPLSLLPLNYEGSQERGLQRGPILDVRKGEIVPIEILVSELGVGGFASMLFVERLDDNGNPLDNDPKTLPLFRTTKHLPPHPKTDFPDFSVSGPVWKVVDSFGKPIPANKYAGRNVTPAFPLAAPGGEKKTAEAASLTAAASASSNKTEPVSSAQPKYEDALTGVIYDITQTSTRKPTDMLAIQTIPDATEYDYNVLPILKQFVTGNWQRRIDGKGNMSYVDLNQFYRSPVLLRTSYFYQPVETARNVIRNHYGEKDVSEKGWVVLHSGYVVAPFTGKFRFVGYGDDALVIRFNRQLVLDYGCFSLTLGKFIGGAEEYRTIYAKKNHGRLLPEKDIYSGKLETCFPNLTGGRGAAKGVTISVEKGQVYPIDILFSDLGGYNAFMLVFIEQLDSIGNPLKKAEKLPLFRTSSDLPAHSGNSGFPDYDSNSPIWKVVDSRGRPIPSRNTTAAAEEKKEPSKSQSTETQVQSQHETGRNGASSNESKTTAATTDPKTVEKKKESGSAQSGKVTNPFGVARPMDEEN